VHNSDNYLKDTFPFFTDLATKNKEIVTKPKLSEKNECIQKDEKLNWGSK